MRLILIRDYTSFKKKHWKNYESSTGSISQLYAVVTIHLFEFDENGKNFTCSEVANVLNYHNMCWPIRLSLFDYKICGKK